MAITVAGTFADRAAAQAAIERRRAAGVPATEISLIVRDTEGAAPVESDVGVRGGAAAPPVNPVLPGAEPVVPTTVVDDEVEPVTAEDYSANSSIILRLKAGISSGLRLVTRPDAAGRRDLLSLSRCRERDRGDVGRGATER